MLLFEMFEDSDLSEGVEISDIIQARELIGRALHNTVEKVTYFNFLKYLRKKYGADYSTRIHQEASKLAKQGQA